MTNRYMMQQIASFNKQGKVKIDYLHGWVTISRSGESVFLQNDDASQFIEQVETLYDEGNLSLKDCESFFAYDFLDLLLH